MPNRETFEVKGKVVSSAGGGIGGAGVRIIGTIDTLGLVREAASSNPTAVAWTRRISGFSGNRWQAWLKFVAQDTSGITWHEFKDLALVYNPSLKETNFLFQADQTYSLPENVDAALDIVWDRPLTGFSGNRYDSWVQFVEGKVIGITWHEYKDEALVHNPQLEDDGYMYKADKSYVLPRNLNQIEYEIFTTTSASGLFKFENVPAGDYQLELRAEGFQPLDQQLIVTGNTQLGQLTLEPIEIETPSPFAQVEGDHFTLQGKPFKFVGVNARGIVHYGDHNTLEHSFEPQKREQLQAAKDMGARVIRVFLPSKHATPAQVEARLQALIDLIKQDFPEMYIIPTLTNLYSDVPFFVQGDEDFYTPPSTSERDTLQASWFDGGYKDNYLPFVERIVKAFKDEPHIFAWEIGNELKVDDNPDLFIKFNHDVAGAIRSWDDNHLITTGIISTRHVYMGGKPDLQKKLYDHPNIDFITNHAYNGQNVEDDSALAKQLGMPFILEETGFDAPPGRDRSPEVSADMDKWYTRGSSGYMQWGYMATGNDNGDGDSISGMDRVLHTDWDTLFETYRQRALAL